MRRIERSALVPYACEQMFDLINDIEAYPDFMKGCVGAEILERGDAWLAARLDLSTAGFKQSFITRNSLEYPHRMTMELQEGPFSRLHGAWEFIKLDESACKVNFWLEFEMSNKLMGLAASKVFEGVASSQVDSVCLRAKRLYGA